MRIAPSRSPATDRTWSAQWPTTSTASRTPTDSTASSIRVSSGRSPTGRRHLCVRSVRGARRRATPAARTMAFTPRRPLGPFRRPPRLVRELGLLDLHLLDQLLVRGGLDDLVELGPVVGDQAHALDDHVVHEP